MNIFPGWPQRANACGFSVGDLSQVSWSREFEDPIPLPDGRKLITLRDAADYITSLPKGIRPPRMANGDRGSDAGVAIRNRLERARRPLSGFRRCELRHMAFRLSVASCDFGGGIEL
jgi:hypothetical protein